MAPILVGAVVDNPPRKRSGPLTSARRPARGPSQVYDAAETSDQNRRHWANADGLSALWANSPSVRRTLRNRSRYEQGSNGYLKGACKTAANDIIGRSGPRHRFAFDSAEANLWLDVEFARWMKAVGFRRKLKTTIRAKKGDGEGILILTTNRALATPVKLDLKPIEAEMLSTPLAAFGIKGDIKDRFGMIAVFAADGIIFDAEGNPSEYHVLKEHPGDSFRFDPVAFDRLPADKVIHWFDADRPGQVRGIPDTSPSLNLAAQLRRYTEASCLTAELQACHSGVLETTGTGQTDDDEQVVIPGVDVERGYFATLPEGYTLKGLDSTHPTSTYAEFKREILSEMGRGMGQPYNVLAADSSRHNYSSARLDTQEYQDDVADERADVEEVILDRVRAAWLAEAMTIPGYVPFPLTIAGELYDTARDGAAPGDWFFSGFGYIDPVKEVTAITLRLTANLTTLKAEHAKNGDDWREVIDQRAVEIEYCRQKGVPLELAVPSPPAADDAPPVDPNNPDGAPQQRMREALAWSL